MTVPPDDDVQLPDIHSEEYRRALAARKGRAKGPHIADDSDDGHMASSTDPYALATFLAELKARSNEPPAAPPPQKVWTLPVIISMAGLFIATCVAGGTLYSYTSAQAATTLQGYTQLGDRLQSFGERLLVVDGRINAVETDIQTRSKDREKQLSLLTLSNAQQDERQQNLTDSLKQERQARMDAEAAANRAEADMQVEINDITKSLADIRADLKVLVDRAQRKSEVDGPERDAKASPAPR